LPGQEFGGRVDADLVADIAELEGRALPLQQQLSSIRAQVDAIRTELRRRERLAQLRSTPFALSCAGGSGWPSSRSAGR